jgi:hypothetical protein
MLGKWHAHAWCGSLGIFASEAQAEAAIRSAPKKPRASKEPPARRPESTKLVEPETAGHVFRGAQQIGGWIKTADGFAAWTRQGRAGVYGSPGLAANAALAAYLEAQAKARAARAALKKGTGP